ASFRVVAGEKCHSFAFAQNQGRRPRAEGPGRPVDGRYLEGFQRRPDPVDELVDDAARGLHEKRAGGDIPYVRALESGDSQEAGGDEGTFDRGGARLADLPRKVRFRSRERLAGEATADGWIELRFDGLLIEVNGSAGMGMIDAV